MLQTGQLYKFGAIHQYVENYICSEIAFQKASQILPHMKVGKSLPIGSKIPHKERMPDRELFWNANWEYYSQSGR